jgi:Tol biopolymer transport system component
VFVGDTESDRRELLFSGSTNAVYSAPGYVLFARDQTLMAQPFDAARLRLTGEASPIAEHVDYSATTIQGQFAASQTGLVAFYSGVGGEDQLVWLDRAGKPVGTIGTPGSPEWPVISPDERTVAEARVDLRTATFDIWLHDLVHGTESRFTFDQRNDQLPIWSPDGTKLIFSSDRSGKLVPYLKASSGASNEEPVGGEWTGSTTPTDWSADGRFVLLNSLVNKTGYDLWVLPMQGDGKAFPFLQTEFNERNGKFSPNGRYVAYESSESGNYEVYVQPFPEKHSKWQVSVKGGSNPVWSRDGKELFYIDADRKLMGTDVSTGAKFEHGIAKQLFEVTVRGPLNYDVSRDGKRFLMSQPLASNVTQSMTLIVNWYTAVKK